MMGGPVELFAVIGVVAFAGLIFVAASVAQVLLPSLFWDGLGYCVRCNGQVVKGIVVCGNCGMDPTQSELKLYRKEMRQ